MSELYIPVERPTRNPINGRFLKGIAPHNKGKTMKYHSLKTKHRSLKNLAKGRGSWHKTGAGLNRKSVVAIKSRAGIKRAVLNGSLKMMLPGVI